MSTREQRQERARRFQAGEYPWVEHGTVRAYGAYGCRCDRCRSANSARNLRERERRHAEMLAGVLRPPHGRYSTYTNYGCRCQPCKDESARVRREHVSRTRDRKEP